MYCANYVCVYIKDSRMVGFATNKQGLRLNIKIIFLTGKREWWTAVVVSIKESYE